MKFHYQKNIAFREIARNCYMHVVIWGGWAQWPVKQQLQRKLQWSSARSWFEYNPWPRAADLTGVTQFNKIWVRERAGSSGGVVFWFRLLSWLRITVTVWWRAGGRRHTKTWMDDIYASRSCALFLRLFLFNKLTHKPQPHPHPTVRTPRSYFLNFYFWKFILICTYGYTYFSVWSTLKYHTNIWAKHLTGFNKQVRSRLGSVHLQMSE